MAINTELLIHDNEWFQEWKELGVKEGRSALLRRLIERKFGPLPHWVEDRLSGATAEQLDECALRILDASALEQIFEYTFLQCSHWPRYAVADAAFRFRRYRRTA